MSTDANEVHFDVLNRLLPVAGLRVLDIGCGKGWLTRRLRAAGARPTGLECTPAQIAAARESDPEHLEDYVEGVGEALPFDDQTFDLAIFSQSLHHVPVASMATALSEAHRVLKPGGHLYVLEPVAAGEMHALDRLIDDETGVRAAALAALEKATGFQQIATQTYDTVYVYQRAEDFVEDMIRVDRKRAQQAQNNSDEIRTVFARTGAPAPQGGRAFRQPNKVIRLQKV
ncbi:MAG: class I SAM-dependent methyltransferase [Aestuariivirgaceae bacterium]